MKPHTKLRALLVHPKDKTDPKEGVYTIDCTGCKKTYVVETKRTLQVRVKEHHSETEKVSKGTNKRQENTITNGDVGVSHNRPCNARKSSYRLGKRTNHRERER